METKTSYRRINISLPEETYQLLGQASKKGNRSRLIDQAVRHYVGSLGRTKLRAAIKEGAIKRAARNLQMSKDWFHLEEEAWQIGNRS